jgi:hypothetical protein
MGCGASTQADGVKYSVASSSACPTLQPKHIMGMSGDKPAGKPNDAIAYVAEGSSFMGKQYDSATCVLGRIEPRDTTSLRPLGPPFYPLRLAPPTHEDGLPGILRLYLWCRRFPLTAELKAKGITDEQWAEICTSLRSGKGMTGFGGGFSAAIAAANETYFDKVGVVGVYAEYGPCCPLCPTTHARVCAPLHPSPMCAPSPPPLVF